MKSIRLAGLFLVALTLAISTQTARADDDSDGDTPSLYNVHKLLKQVSEDLQNDNPQVDSDMDLLHKANHMIDQIPHVYHGELKAATKDINAAISELTQGDTSRAKEDVYDADDEIKSIM